MEWVRAIGVMLVLLAVFSTFVVVFAVVENILKQREQKRAERLHLKRINGD